METMQILPPSWKTLLTPLRPLVTKGQQAEPPRVALVGIGNEFNGDDAAGVMVARRLAKRQCAADAPHLLVIEAGQAPENITGELRRFEPQSVLLVDAAQMDAEPGQVALIPWEAASGLSACTHSLPLSMLARYLTLEFGCVVTLIGIQPAQNEPGTGLSPRVRATVDEVVTALCKSLLTTRP